MYYQRSDLSIRIEVQPIASPNPKPNLSLLLNPSQILLLKTKILFKFKLNSYYRVRLAGPGDSGI